MPKRSTSGSLSQTWGTTPAERRLAFPCDHLIADADAAYFRGVTIDASAPVVFRWLCQLRVAPYSYDWIDNRGRQSPRQLTPGLDQLEVGQDLMTIFDLVSFDRDRHLTMRIKHHGSAVRTFGDIAGSYVVVPNDSGSCRLLVKLLVRYPRGVRGWLIRTLLPWGDLIMMRRQLLTLKALAERVAASPLRSICAMLSETGCKSLDDPEGSDRTNAVRRNEPSGGGPADRE
jgi:hypothetical protein